MIAALERDFPLRGSTPEEFALRARDLWVGLTQEQLAAAFAGAPWLEGIHEVWADIRSRGDFCAVISLSPDFFVERLLPWGAHATHGSRWPSVPFTEPVGRSLILNARAKVKIANRHCTEFKMQPDEEVAYGDSLSDADIRRGARGGGGECGPSHDRACHAYSGSDLREAYELVRLRP